MFIIIILHKIQYTIIHIRFNKTKLKILFKKHNNNNLDLQKKF